MMLDANEWKTVKIADLGRVVTGKTPPTSHPEFFGDEYPFITPTDIETEARHVKTERFLSQAGAEKQKGQLLPAGATCVVCIASIGKTCMTSCQSITNQQINSVIPDLSLYDPFFVYYLLRHEAKDLIRIAGGVAAPIINKSSFSELSIRVPPLPTQRKIAAILSAYDDLIENNTRRIQILEDMAQALYREWFVHFRFPGHERSRMGESEMGPMPEGWSIKPLGSFGRIVTGKTPSKDDARNFNNDVPFVKIPDMHSNVFCVKTAERLSSMGAASQKTKSIPPDSICVSCIGTAGIVCITGFECQTNQQINSIVLDKPFYREFLYFTAVGLREKINLYGSNGATMVNLNKEKFQSLKVPAPPDILLGQFCTIVCPFFDHIKLLQNKNLNLSQTRDLLLPKLISGEVDVTGLDIALSEIEEDKGAVDSSRPV